MLRVDTGLTGMHYHSIAALKAGRHDENAVTDKKRILDDFMSSILLRRAKGRFASTS
jgi:hypothetical protein